MILHFVMSIFMVYVFITGSSVNQNILSRLFVRVDESGGVEQGLLEQPASVAKFAGSWTVTSGASCSRHDAL